MRDLRHAAPLGNVLKAAAFGVTHVQESAHLTLTEAGGFRPGPRGGRQMCRDPTRLSRPSCVRRRAAAGKLRAPDEAQRVARSGLEAGLAQGRRVRPTLSTWVAKAEGSRSVPPGTSAGSYHITQCSI